MDELGLVEKQTIRVEQELLESSCLGVGLGVSGILLLLLEQGRLLVLFCFALRLAALLKRSLDHACQQLNLDVNCHTANDIPKEGVPLLVIVRQINDNFVSIRMPLREKCRQLVFQDNLLVVAFDLALQDSQSSLLYQNDGALVQIYGIKVLATQFIPYEYISVLCGAPCFDIVLFPFCMIGYGGRPILVTAISSFRWKDAKLCDKRCADLAKRAKKQDIGFEEIFHMTNYD
eukprot:scaffold66976_cov30-Attheya_sp.AAC.2